MPHSRTPGAAMLEDIYSRMEGDRRKAAATESAAPAIAVDVLFNSLFWLVIHGCPMPTLRDPNWAGPHHSCRILLLSFIQAAVCSWLAPESELVRYCSVPAFLIALASVSGFLLSMEERFRASFWQRDTKHQLLVRLFDNDDAQLSIEQLDDDRAFHLAGDTAPYLEEVHGDAVRRWLAVRGPVWAASRPDWLTDSWVRGLPDSLQLCVAKAMRVNDGELVC
jgi:hypothetical protein